MNRLRGIIRGKTIELEAGLGLPEGQEVTVTVEAARRWGEGLRRSFGSWAEDAEEVDRFVAWTYAQREADRR